MPGTGDHGPTCFVFQAGQLEGLMFSLIVVVSFHGTFVTKVDRAYRCMCFFQNIKRVTNILDIRYESNLPMQHTVICQEPYAGSYYLCNVVHTVI